MIQKVLGFITPHSYLDNPTFRGMCKSLMQSFNDIFILDVNGNSLKKERCPDGSKDENVFDIRQGTAIALFIKQSAEKPADTKGKNKDQYFEGVIKAVWEYQIGGYQVCSKWLKDRKGWVLALEEIKHYCTVVTAIKKTIEIQKDIDAVYPGIEKEIIDF